jgi:hypothetical protein
MELNEQQMLVGITHKLFLKAKVTLLLYIAQVALAVVIQSLFLPQFLMDQFVITMA